MGRCAFVYSHFLHVQSEANCIARFCNWCTSRYAAWMICFTSARRQQPVTCTMPSFGTNRIQQHQWVAERPCCSVCLLNMPWQMLPDNATSNGPSDPLVLCFDSRFKLHTTCQSVQRTATNSTSSNRCPCGGAERAACPLPTTTRFCCGRCLLSNELRDLGHA